MVVKRSRTPKAVHSIMVRKYHDKEAIELVYLAATQKIMYQRQNVLKKNWSSVVSIVKEVNRLYDTALTPIAIRRRVSLHHPATARGRAKTITSRSN